MKQQYVCLAMLLAAGVACQKPAASQSSQAPAATAGATAPAPGAAASTSAAPMPSAPATPPAPKPVPADLPSVIAKVNGDDIQRVEFETTIKNVESRAGRPVPPEQRDQVYRGVLEDLIALRLLKQEVARRQLTASDAELAEAMKGMRQQFPTEAAFKQALTAQKMTLEQLREETRTQVLVSKMLQQEVGSQVAVKPTEISGFYEKNPDKFQQPEAVRASHVLITVPEGAAPAARAAARAKAEDVLKQARAGVDFAKLARTFSDDASKGRGGDLGFFPRGVMPPRLHDAVREGCSRPCCRSVRFHQ